MVLSFSATFIIYQRFNMVYAAVTCFPLDVLRTRMMTPDHSKGVLVTIYEMLAYEGVGSFYTGCLPAILSMALGGAVFYGTYVPIVCH
jgi:hypothetical protein